MQKTRKRESERKGRALRQWLNIYFYATNPRNLTVDCALRSLGDGKGDGDGDEDNKPVPELKFKLTLSQVKLKILDYIRIPVSRLSERECFLVFVVPTWRMRNIRELLCASSAVIMS